MTVENLPNLDLPDFGQVHDAARPVLSYGWKAGAPHRAAAHSHPRAHIIYVEFGAYWIVTAEGTWLAPAGRAIWIPPDVHHEVYSHGAVAARILFVDQAHAGPLPGRCGTVEVGPFLAALLSRTVEYGNDYAPNGPAARLALVMLDELAAMDFAPSMLPISREPRIARVMRKLIDDPQSRDRLEHLAKEAGASPRTLARLFRTETGMTFTQWKTNLLLAEAIERLAQGATVTEVAADLGYGTTSGFVYMFRRNLGVPPGHYRLRRGSDGS